MSKRTLIIIGLALLFCAAAFISYKADKRNEEFADQEAEPTPEPTPRKKKSKESEPTPEQVPTPGVKESENE